MKKTIRHFTGARSFIRESAAPKIPPEYQHVVGKIHDLYLRWYPLEQEHRHLEAEIQKLYNEQEKISDKQSDLHDKAMELLEQIPEHVLQANDSELYLYLTPENWDL